MHTPSVSSPTPRQIGVPDWLQSTGSGESTLLAVKQSHGGGRTLHESASGSPAGGLDWLQALSLANSDRGKPSPAIASPPPPTEDLRGGVPRAAAKHAVPEVAASVTGADEGV